VEKPFLEERRSTSEANEKTVLSRYLNSGGGSRKGNIGIFSDDAFQFYIAIRRLGRSDCALDCCEYLWPFVHVLSEVACMRKMKRMTRSQKTGFQNRRNKARAIVRETWRIH
jgi:hypothetical protein